VTPSEGEKKRSVMMGLAKSGTEHWRSDSDILSKLPDKTHHQFLCMSPHERFLQSRLRGVTYKLYLTRSRADKQEMREPPSKCFCGLSWYGRESTLSFQNFVRRSCNSFNQWIERAEGRKAIQCYHGSGQELTRAWKQMRLWLRWCDSHFAG